MAGFYNDNIRIDTPSGPVIVRIPILGADVMDLRAWPESEVLRGIGGTVRHAPRLLHASHSPPFQVLEYIDGQVLSTSAPRGTRVPHHVIDDVIELFNQLGRVPLELLSPLPDDWPTKDETRDFAHQLLRVTADAYHRFLPDFSQLFDDLNIPPEPIDSLWSSITALHPRQFRLLHADLHRKNMVIVEGRTYFLDWELALWGDPVYDLAVHLHKMGYQPDESAALLACWDTSLPGSASAGWQVDLGIYMAHEKVKSAITDTVRYANLIVGNDVTPTRKRTLVNSLADKLAAAQAVFHGAPATCPPDPVKILAAIRRWSDSR